MPAVDRPMLVPMPILNARPKKKKDAKTVVREQAERLVNGLIDPK